MQSSVRFLAGVGAIGLLVLGIIQPVEKEPLWLICLWGAAPLMGVFAWLSIPPVPRGFARSLHNLGLVVLVGFVLLSLQLLRQQVIKAEAIYTHTVVSESGYVTTNVRPVVASQRVVRGKIIDQTGLHLASSEVVENGFVRRIYPIAEAFDIAAFSNIVGFFSTRYGQSGLERTYNEYLTGERGDTLARLQDELLGHPQVGNDLHLTLNALLQAHAYTLLGGRSGSIIVLNPKSGAVLAMVSVPGFDLRGLSFDYTADDWNAENMRISQYWQHINSGGAGQPLINRPTQGLYPPGSTFKTVTAVAVLENAQVGRPDDIRCTDEFKPEPSSPPVVNAVRHGLSSYTGDPSDLERVYAYSCNVAFAKYAIRLGADRLSHQALLFDIFPPHEAPRSYEKVSDLFTAASLLYIDPGFLDRPAALADTGYGQGQLLVTPLQMTMVAAAIANDGVMMRPYLVDRVVFPETGQVVFEQIPQQIRRTMSSETAATMRDNMRAVGQYGFGSVVNNYSPAGVTFGGKSGTGEHVPGLPPHAWFIAIAPVDDPRYAVVVMVEQGGEGSSVAAQLAGQVLQAAFEIE